MGGRLIVIGGPTASGKTRLAIDVARHFQTEILSADSRQFYREMRIGNARPAPEELAAVPHHFVADRSLHAPLSAGRFAEAALAVLNDLFERHGTVVLVGGSGLYLRALCAGLDEFPEVTDEARARVQRLLETRGLRGLQEEVALHDPDYFSVVDRQNGRRLERALRVTYSAGVPYSNYLGQTRPRPFISHYFQPAIDRPSLYARIDARVEVMLGEGLEAEARTLEQHKAASVLQTVGYQEWWPCFAGEYDHDRAVELIKRNSRRYAKRQLTWFRDYTPVTGTADIVERIAGGTCGPTQQ